MERYLDDSGWALCILKDLGLLENAGPVGKCVGCYLPENSIQWLVQTKHIAPATPNTKINPYSMTVQVYLDADGVYEGLAMHKGYSDALEYVAANCAEDGSVVTGFFTIVKLHKAAGQDIPALLGLHANVLRFQGLGDKSVACELIDPTGTSLVTTEIGDAIEKAFTNQNEGWIFTMDTEAGSCPLGLQTWEMGRLEEGTEPEGYCEVYGGILILLSFITGKSLEEITKDILQSYVGPHRGDLLLQLARRFSLNVTRLSHAEINCC